MANTLEDDLRQRIVDRQVVAIVGAGVSIGATGGEPKVNGKPLASWPGLLEHGVDYCRQNMAARLEDEWDDVVRGLIRLKTTHGLVLAAEAISQELGAPEGGDFKRWLRRAFESLPIAQTELIEAIHGLNVPIITTNYDDLIGRVTGRRAITWQEGNEVELALTDPESMTVIHMHGHWRKSGSVILGVDSYGKIRDDAPAQAMLRAARALKTLLFIGVGDGLSDPNFGALRAWSRTAFAGSEIIHFRLARNADVRAVQEEHPPEERITVLGFGEKHDDLASYLRDLKPKPQPPVHQPSTNPQPAPALPTKPPHCYGRDEQVKELVKALTKANPEPIPILGGPGIGKSTIAVVALHETRVAKKFGSRRYFVRLDAAKSRAAVVGEIARAMGVELGPELEATVFGDLARAPAALVLDNAETPWEGERGPFEDLLATLGAIGGLALAVSIRSGVRPGGPAWREAMRVEPLDLDPARRAFLEIAGWKFQGDPKLDDLLNAVDRVPLAVVLLAHVAESYSDLTEVCDRWQAEKTTMIRRAGGEDKLTNLDVSLEFSVVRSPRMTSEARRLLTLLGILPDGIARSDLNAVLSGDGPRAAATPRDVGLAYDQADRLRVLAPIREHIAACHLPRPDDLTPALDHYLTLAHTEGPKVGAEGGAEAAQRLAPEIANLNATILHVLARPDPTLAIDAACDLADLIRFSGLGTTHTLKRARDVARQANDQRREAGCLFNLGKIALHRSDHGAARARYEEALPLFRRVGDVLGEANCIRHLGVIASQRSDHGAARARFEEALPLYRRVGDALGEAKRIERLGDMALQRSDHESARSRYEEALSLYRRVGDALGEANYILYLGEIALRRSDHESARSRFEEALALYRKVGDVQGEANCIQGLGEIALRRSDHESARSRFEEALALYRKVGDVQGGANCIKGLGDIALRRSDHESARSRYEEALALYRKVGDVQGEANCIQGLGDIALRRSDHESARSRYEESLRLYQRIAEPYCIGTTYCRLAYVAAEADERLRHARAAREAWRSIGREDLVETGLAEFGTLD